MKGVVLAGGTGSRLYPLTKSINKHCLPVYDRPMIYYPIQSLVAVGITDILLVTGGNHMSQFIDLLGDGSDLGCNINYACQMKPGGIAEALSLAEDHVGTDSVCVILGDNIFNEDIQPWKFMFEWHTGVPCRECCHLVCKPVDEPQNYGVLTDDGMDIEIVEKPENPESDLCVTGLYFYSNDVFEKIKKLTPSHRNELEVTDLNNLYGKANRLFYSITKEEWYDCGVDIDHMLEVANKVKELK